MSYYRLSLIINAIHHETGLLLAVFHLDTKKEDLSFTKDPLFIEQVINKNSLRQNYKRHKGHEIPVSGFVMKYE